MQICTGGGQVKLFLHKTLILTTAFLIITIITFLYSCVPNSSFSVNEINENDPASTSTSEASTVSQTPDTASSVWGKGIFGQSKWAK